MGCTKPVTGVAMTLFLMLLVSIPPIAGCACKFLRFDAAMDAHFAWLALLAILNSVLSLAVYLRIIVSMYRLRDEGDKAAMQQNGQMLLIRTVWLSQCFDRYPWPRLNGAAATWRHRLNHSYARI